MAKARLPNGGNGQAAAKRGPGGQFAKGTAGGPGNPYTRHVGQLRSALFNAVTPEDLDAIVRRLVGMAKEGDLGAIREVLDRTLGKPVEADLLERLETLEQRTAAAIQQRENLP